MGRLFLNVIIQRMTLSNRNFVVTKRRQSNGDELTPLLETGNHLRFQDEIDRES